ncbi:MAG: hypothetical protein VYC34_01350, partial [Planctomycetota bacterium]|nr:hypothetical protein [Planctomycetota bacterium]
LTMSVANGQAGNDPFANFPDLTAGLMDTEGCLGVEVAQTGSGKNVIFAWFKDKESCLNWYYHPMHRGAMKTFFPDSEDAGQPLEDVPHDVGPIMAIASITFDQKANFEQTDLPISQIAIELYTPLKGGISLGGTFAPAAMDVPGVVRLDD